MVGLVGLGGWCQVGGLRGFGVNCGWIVVFGWVGCGCLSGA